VLDLAAGAGLLIHHAMFRPVETAQALTFSHCVDENAIRLAEKAGVRRLALFHHAPLRSDNALDAAAGRFAAASVEVVVAREGDSYTL
jgi:ribonuclease BN (tRNA processing enzyme)